eukprot:scaffold8065_cov267-Pinguiococcus_pyrenoidosus.AAC.12
MPLPPSQHACRLACALFIAIQARDSPHALAGYATFSWDTLHSRSDLGNSVRRPKSAMLRPSFFALALGSLLLSSEAFVAPSRRPAAGYRRALLRPPAGLARKQATLSLSFAPSGVIVAQADAAASATADLPPVWVPIALAALILVGAGLLQLDLGDIFGEEEQLENAIGDKAKSTREARERSYFTGSGGEL